MFVNLNEAPVRKRKIFGLFSEVEDHIEKSRVAPDATRLPRRAVPSKRANVNFLGREIAIAADCRFLRPNGQEPARSRSFASQRDQKSAEFNWQCTTLL